MIKPILFTLCELSGWYFLNIAQPSSLLSSQCHLKKHVLHSIFGNGSKLINIHELLTLILLLISNKFLSKTPPTRINCCIACWTCMKGITCGLLMVSNSSVQHVVWDMFSLVKFESFISILSNAKYVNNQGTKLDGSNVPRFGSMVTEYFSSHSQDER